MIGRAIAILVVVTILAGLVIYSQTRTQAPRVSGVIESDEIRVGSRIGGRVRAVLVEEGQSVQPGDVLVELEPYDLLERERQAAMQLAEREAQYSRMKDGWRDEEIAQAEANYNQLKARLDLLEAGPRAEEKEAARGRIAVARAELNLAEQNHNRVASLVERNAVSTEELDKAIQALEAARAMENVRKQELAILQAGTRDEEIREAAARVEEAFQAWQLVKTGNRPEDIEQAAAARDAARAALNIIVEQKKELTITSPVAGTVEALDLQPGDLVAAGAPVLSVSDPSRMWVRAYLPQRYLSIQTGQVLDVTVDALPQRNFAGTVAFVAREAEFTPSNVQTIEERAKQVFRIKVTLADDQNQLRPGMSVDVWLESLDAASDGS